MIEFIGITVVLVAIVLTYRGHYLRPWAHRLWRRVGPTATERSVLSARLHDKEDLAFRETWEAPTEALIARIRREIEPPPMPCTDDTHDHTEVSTFGRAEPTRRLCTGTSEDLRERLAAKMRQMDDMAAVFAHGETTEEQLAEWRQVVEDAKETKSLLIAQEESARRTARLPYEAMVRFATRRETA